MKFLRSLMIFALAVCIGLIDKDISSMQEQIRCLNTQTINIVDRLNYKLDLSVMESIGILTNGQGHGSCVAISPSLLVTAKHCLGHNCWVEIGGKKYEVLAEYSSDKYDVGFVRIKGRVKSIKLGDMPKVLDEVYSVGAPASVDLINSISKGVVSKLNANIHIWKDCIIADCSCSPGNSGGALLNKNGELIGIVVGRTTTGDSVIMCETITHIMRTLAECPI